MQKGIFIKENAGEKLKKCLWAMANCHFFTTFAPAFRGVAQLVALLVWDQAVARSSRVAPTKSIMSSFMGLISFFSKKMQALSKILSIFAAE